MAGMLCLAVTATAQEPVIKRSAPMTMTGEIVDISCYKSKGVAGGTGAAHVDCAKICILQKDGAVGILSDGDGLFKIWGGAAKDTYAKVMPYIGQQVEITGTEVTLSNNYDVRSFDLQTVKRKGK
jgi:DNA/RNA endonuclease YhcR with UshA esterase domain